MNRDEGIKRLKEVLASLPEDRNLWPNSSLKLNECGCILQQAAGDECIVHPIIRRPYKTVLPYMLGKILGLEKIEAQHISNAYDGMLRIELTRLIGELK